MRLATLVATLAMVAVPAAARAGIVNVQSILASEVEEGLSASVTASVDWRTGNSDVLLGSVAPVARLRRGDHIGFLILRGEIGRANGVRNVAKTFAHLRYRYEIDPRWLGETFAQHEYDEFRRLRSRALFGGGPRYMVYDSDASEIACGVAYMFEIEDLDDNSEAVDAGVTNYQHRISSYLLASTSLADNLTLVETLYAQPRIDEPADIRLLNESQLVVAISDRVAINTAFTLAYDARPPDTVEGLETALKSSVTIGF